MKYKIYFRKTDIEVDDHEYHLLCIFKDLDNVFKKDEVIWFSNTPYQIVEIVHYIEQEWIRIYTVTYDYFANQHRKLNDTLKCSL